MTSQFSEWHSIKREEIDWHPTVDSSKCVGCGLCVVTCGEKRNVYGYDKERKKAVVLFPDNCMVGCTNCMVGCLWDAISFPEAKAVNEIVKTIPAETLANEFNIKINKNPSLRVE